MSYHLLLPNSNPTCTTVNVHFSAPKDESERESSPWNKTSSSPREDPSRAHRRIQADSSVRTEHLVDLITTEESRKKKRRWQKSKMEMWIDMSYCITQMYIYMYMYMCMTLLNDSKPIVRPNVSPCTKHPDSSRNVAERLRQNKTRRSTSCDRSSFSHSIKHDLCWSTECRLLAGTWSLIEKCHFSVKYCVIIFVYNGK